MKKYILLVVLCSVVNWSYAQSKTVFAYDTKGNMTSTKFTGETSCSVQQPLAAAKAESKELVEVNEKVYPVFKVFPNPTIGQSRLEYKIPSTSMVYISILNSQGQKVIAVLSQQVESGTYNKIIDLENFANGVYFIIANVDGKAYSLKIQKASD